MADDDNDKNVFYWNQHPTYMSIERSHHAVVAVDKYRALITGGLDLSSAEMFDCRDPQTTTPITVPNTSRKRRMHASIYCENYVYVIGGFGDGKSVERIDLTTATATAEWEAVASMNQNRPLCAAALHNKIIYVFGGLNNSETRSTAELYGDKALSTAELYDTTKPNEGWKTIPEKIKQGRRGHCAVTVGDEIFIMGGNDNDDYDYKTLDSVEIFNTTNQSFRDGPTMPMPLEGMSAVVRGTYIVLCGEKYTNAGNISTSILLSILDTESMKWSVIGNHLLRQPRHSHASVLLNDNIYMFGGENSSKETLNSIEFTPFIEMLPPPQLLEGRKNHGVGIGDTPNGPSPDRLGYTTYAKALVSIAQKVEGPNTSFCVSLNAPWGAGKSFLCKLIKGQLESDERNAYKQRKEEEKKQDQEQKQQDGQQEQKQQQQQQQQGQQEQELLYKLPFKNIMKQMNIKQMKDYTTSTLDSLIEKPFHKYFLQNIIIFLVSFIPFIIIMLTAFLVGFVFATIVAVPLLCLDIFKGAATHSYEKTEDVIEKILENQDYNHTWLKWFIVVVFLPIWVSLWVSLSILSIVDHMNILIVLPFSQLIKKALDRDDLYPQDEKGLTKYIFVNFNTWDYNKADQLWTAVLISIWEAIGDVYGHEKLRKYRSAVELEIFRNGRNTHGATGKSLYDKRKNALKSFKTRSIMLALFTAITSLGAVVEFLNDDDMKALKTNFFFIAAATVLFLELILLARYLYIFFRYILPEPMVLQLRDDTSSERAEYLGDTGYKGFVKDEFQYILDFLRFAPFPDPQLKCMRRPHLSIFVDDVDRCDGNTVMDVLEAVILLLVDAPVTCWLALDTRLVVASIEEAKKGVLEQAGVSGYDFMEKIVQLPFCIPDLDNDQKLNYVSRLFLQGQLDEIKLASVIKEVERTSKRQLTNPADISVQTDLNSPEEDSESAFRFLLNKMKYFISLSLNANHYESFESRIITDPDKVIKEMEKAINEDKLKDMDGSEKEDFLFLVCEWIEWFQESRTKLPSIKFSEGTGEGLDTSDEGKADVRPLVIGSDGSGEEKDDELPQVAKTDGSAVQTSTNDVENPVSPPFRTMVTYNEKQWFDRYVQYMNGQARTMTRIINLYNVARYLIVYVHPRADDIFKEKLLKIIILCEQWPYRMSWLMQIAEDVTQESALKKEKQETNDRSQQVFDDLQYLGFKILKKDKNMGHKDYEQGDEKADELFRRLRRLSLFDIYHLVVESLLHAPENAKNSLSRDGDPQVFEQLLAEQGDNKDCQLKLIDLALPDQFQGQRSSNLSLRPFMINMSRHMTETAASYMEGCVIHENANYKGDSFGPRLLIESTKSYYEKGKKLEYEEIIAQLKSVDTVGVDGNKGAKIK